MCGIVGVFGSLSADHEKAFRQLLIVDQIRGEHSTGIAAVSRNNAFPTIVKSVGTPEQLAELKAYDRAFQGMNRAFIGHNRFATVGRISTATAHPFSFGSITGVHNGTLRGYMGLDGYADYDVDSQVLYNHISTKGLTDAISKASGAMALMFWDRAREEMTLYRNSERPLWVIPTADNKAMFVASEPWMVYGILGRLNIKHIECVEVPADHSMTFHLPSNVYGDLAKPHLRFHEPKKITPVVTSYTSGYFGNYQGDRKPIMSVVGGTDAKKESGSNAAVIENNAKPTESLSEAHPVMGAKDLLFEMEGFDVVRGISHSLFSCANPKYQGLVFLGSGNLPTRLGLIQGSFLTGECNGIKWENNVPHYMLNESTLDVIEADPVGALTESGEADNEVESDMPDEVRDWKNRFLPLSEWRRLHGTCANCTGDVCPKDHVFDSNGNVFCEECATNPVYSDIIKA